MFFSDSPSRGTAVVAPPPSSPPPLPPAARRRLRYITLAYQNSEAAKFLDWAALFTSIGVVITAVFLGLSVSARASVRALRSLRFFACFAFLAPVGGVP